MEKEKMMEAVLIWWRDYGACAASKAMALHLCGIPIFFDAQYWTPRDPQDIGACMRFLAAVPGARAELPKMAEVSRQWASLVARWDELERVYEEERWMGRLPKTYQLMREIIKKGG